MDEKQFLDLARAAVPPHLKTLGKIVKHEQPQEQPHTVAAAAGKKRAAAPTVDDDLLAALAKEVGAKLQKAPKNSADVEFVEHTPIGTRATVVQIRDGKVTQVLKRG